MGNIIDQINIWRLFVIALAISFPPARAAVDVMAPDYSIPYTVPVHNENNDLSWAESYRLQFLLRKYEATENINSLREFIARADQVLNARDDNRQTSIQPRWSEKITCSGTPVASAGTDGLIIYPLTRFAWLIKERNLHHEPVCSASTASTQTTCSRTDTIGDVAVGYINKAIQTINSHSLELSDEKKGYLFPVEASCKRDYEDRVQPYNLDHAMGRALIMAYLVTQDRSLLLSARKLTHWFKDELARHSEYSWPTWFYWQGDNQYEDISHGSIVVDFVYLSWQNGIDFLHEDIQKMAITVSKIVPSSEYFYQKVTADVSLKCNKLGNSCDSSNYTFSGLARDIPSYLNVLAPQGYDHEDTATKNTIANIKKISESTRSSSIDTSELLAIANLAFFTRNAGYNSDCAGNIASSRGDGACTTGSCFGYKWHFDKYGTPDAKCGVPLGYGSYCKRDSECASGSCYANTVCGFRLGAGSSCYRDVECGSSLCDNGSCR